MRLLYSHPLLHTDKPFNYAYRILDVSRHSSPYTWILQMISSRFTLLICCMFHDFYSFPSSHQCIYPIISRPDIFHLIYSYVMIVRICINYIERAIYLNPDKSVDIWPNRKIKAAPWIFFLEVQAQASENNIKSGGAVPSCSQQRRRRERLEEPCQFRCRELPRRTSYQIELP